MYLQKVLQEGGLLYMLKNILEQEEYTSLLEEIKPYVSEDLAMVYAIDTGVVSTVKNVLFLWNITSSDIGYACSVRYGFKWGTDNIPPKNPEVCGKDTTDNMYIMDGKFDKISRQVYAEKKDPMYKQVLEMYAVEKNRPYIHILFAAEMHLQKGNTQDFMYAMENYLSKVHRNVSSFLENKGDVYFNAFVNLVKSAIMEFSVEYSVLKLLFHKINVYTNEECQLRILGMLIRENLTKYIQELGVYNPVIHLVIQAVNSKDTGKLEEILEEDYDVEGLPYIILYFMGIVSADEAEFSHECYVGDESRVIVFRISEGIRVHDSRTIWAYHIRNGYIAGDKTPESIPSLIPDNMCKEGGFWVSEEELGYPKPRNKEKLMEIHDAILYAQVYPSTKLSDLTCIMSWLDFEDITEVRWLTQKIIQERIGVKIGDPSTKPAFVNGILVVGYSEQDMTYLVDYQFLGKNLLTDSFVYTLNFFSKIHGYDKHQVFFLDDTNMSF